MGKLVLSYRFDRSHFDDTLDRDDFGRLSLRIETENFTGRGGFWVQWQNVVEFGDRLDVYPIKTDAPIVAEWGYEMLEGEELIIRIAIEAKNKTGDLQVSVVISDDLEPSQRLSVSFRSDYTALDLFRRDIANLMRGEAEEAVLQGY